MKSWLKNIWVYVIKNWHANLSHGTVKPVVFQDWIDENDGCGQKWLWASRSCVAKINCTSRMNWWTELPFSLLIKMQYVLFRLPVFLSDWARSCCLISGGVPHLLYMPQWVQWVSFYIVSFWWDRTLRSTADMNWYCWLQMPASILF